MNRKIKYIVIFIISICMLVITSNVEDKEYRIYYRDYITKLNNRCNNNFSKALVIVEDKLDDRHLNNHEKGINLVARQTYLFFEKDYKKAKKYFIETEKFLIKNKMYEELVYVYSIMSNIAKIQYEYEKAYLYIYEAEVIIKLIYENKKDEETLSTLMAIKYFKATMALDIGLKDEAKKEFEKAEQLRKNYKGRNRSDVHQNIAIYYYQQEYYEKSKEYALESIKIMEGIKQYELDNIAMKILLGHAYIELGEIDKTLKIAKELEKLDIKDLNEERNNKLIRQRLILYSVIYKYYNEIDKSIEKLEEAYKLVNESKDIICKVKIMNEIIYLNKKIGNEEDLNYWYEQYYIIYEKERNFNKNQYLMSKIMNTDDISTKAHIKILQLQRKNLRYISTILIIILLIIASIIARLKYINKHDDLTSIYNRGYFNKIYNRYKSNKEKYTLCIFDIDNFKKLNDTYGHDFGDTVLINTSKAIKDSLNKDCKLFRYGGEEFIVVVENDNIEYALKVAEDIRKIVENLTWKENTTVTISIGVASSKDTNNDVFKKADENLYKSKQNGKNRVTYN